MRAMVPENENHSYIARSGKSLGVVLDSLFSQMDAAIANIGKHHILGFLYILITFKNTPEIVML
jgi:hypothetical protein